MVICHPAEVRIPLLSPADLATPEGCKAELTYVMPGLRESGRLATEPVTCQSQVQRNTAALPCDASLSCSRRTRATLCVTSIVLYTKVDAQLSID